MYFYFIIFVSFYFLLFFSSPDIIDESITSPLFSPKIKSDITDLLSASLNISLKPSNLANGGLRSPKPSINNGMDRLIKCQTPAVGELFQVHVTMASNPHNFKVNLFFYKCYF